VTSVPPPGHRSSGESWGWSPEAGERRSSPGPQRLEPLSRRLLGVVAALSALLIVAVGYAWTSGGDNSLNPIAEAAANTAEAPGSRLAIRAVYTSPLLPSPVTARGGGVYNGRTGRSRAWLEMDVPTTAATVRFDTVGDAHRVFIRSPLLTDKLPSGDRWISSEPGIAHSPETTLAGNSDARGQLELLRAVGGRVEKVGRQEVRGVETTRYRGHFDLRGYAAQVRREGDPRAAHQYERLAKTTPSSTIVEVWVDDGGDLVRQARIRGPEVAEPGAPPVTVEVNIAYFDFGATPRIELPSPKRAFDATLIGRAELGLLNADSVQVASPPPGAKRLTRRQLVARSKALVREVKPELSPLIAKGKALGEEFKRSIGLYGPQARPTLNTAHRIAVQFEEPAIRRMRRLIDRFGRLAPSAPLRRRYRRWLRLTALELEFSLAATRAIEIGDYEFVHNVSSQAKRASHRAKRLADSLGLESWDRSVKHAAVPA
jgi:hypothetical protein